MRQLQISRAGNSPFGDRGFPINIGKEMIRSGVNAQTPSSYYSIPDETRNWMKA